MNDEAVNHLARRAGSPWNGMIVKGVRRSSTPDVLRRILAALGLPSSTRGELAASRRQLTRNASLQALPPLVTATAGRPTRLDAGASEARQARIGISIRAAADVSILPVRGRLRVPAITEVGLPPVADR